MKRLSSGSAVVAAAATTGIIETADPVQSVWEEAIKLLDQLQAHAQEQVQVQGELVSELLNHLQEALNGNSATVGGMLQEHSANETVSDGWEIWARSHAEHLSAAADAAVQVLELLRPPDATQEVAAATAIGEAFMSLFDDADNFASNALADGATYGEGSSPQTGATAAAPTAPSHTATSNYSTYPFPFTAQLSRGVFYEQVYDSFVATGASFARQHRWADHYEGLHYGTVDVRATAPGTAGGRSGRADVDIDIEVTLLDNRNRPIIRRVLTALPLSHFGRLNRDNAASVADMMAHWDALPNEPLTTTMQPIVQAAARHACDFLPFHGHTPAWRKRVAKWGLLAMPFLGLLVPVVTLAVLLCRAAWELTGACWDGLLDTASADEPPAEDADDQPLPRSPKSLSPTAPELPAPAPARKGGARRRPPR